MMATWGFRAPDDAGAEVRNVTTKTGKGRATRFNFTRASVDRATCPAGKSQALYCDTEQPGLGLRVTANGARAFIFEGKLGRQTVRMTIGPASMPIRTPKDKHGRPVASGADNEAARLAALVGQGIDPRAEKAELIARQAEQREQAKVERQRLDVTGLEAWNAYLEARASKWGERNLADHRAMTKEGGEKRKRGKGSTMAGPLRPLLARPLASIDAEAVRGWLKKQSADRPARAALGFRLLNAFINWCGEHPEYRNVVRADACKDRRTREEVAAPKARQDTLQREQLAAWFAEVRKLSPVSSAYLQGLLLTGARREEMAGLRWQDVDFTWRTLRLRDKVEGERTIPLPPYLASVLRGLPSRRRPTQSEWVFASRASASGRVTEPRIAHNRALQAAGLPHVSLHGLRRSFGSLAEWVEMPAGIVAQVMGHKPSATAERHYRVRPVDLLRLWHDKLEAWMLAEAKVTFDAEQAERDAAEADKAGGLRVVKGGKVA
jgi:integrase